MAAIPVVLNGTFTTDSGSVNGVFQGTIAYSDRAPGGGPVVPPGIWGGSNEGFPTHPIAPGGPPPGIWPGPGPLPHPEHPIAPGGPPPKPAHPIELPPPSIWPPGPGVDFPAHPIVIPDPGNPVIPPGTLINWKTYWSEETGWVVVGVPNVPHPAPA